MMRHETKTRGEIKDVNEEEMENGKRWEMQAIGEKKEQACVKGGKIYVQVMIPVSSSNVNRTFGLGRVFQLTLLAVLAIYLRARACVCVCVCARARMCLIQWDLISRHRTDSID